MEKMVSIPESRYIELIRIEQKYKASDFSNDNDKLSVLYVELNSVINAGLSVSNDERNDSVWRRVYNKVFGLDSSICSRWRELVPGFTWYDPDSSYYDDVMAFYHAVQNYLVANNIVSEYQI